METSDKKALYSDIVSMLHTKNEADMFFTQLDLLSESLFTNKTSVKQKINELFSSEIAISILDIWKKAGIETNNLVAVQLFLDELKETIKHTPVINITIAFKPRQRTTQKIVDWIASRLKTPVLVDIKVEKQIIGGAIIEFHGKHFEYTIHKALGEKIIPLLKEKNT